MKRLMTVLGAMAVVGLMAGTACADLTNFQLGMNEFCLSNCSYPMGAAFQPGGWTARPTEPFGSPPAAVRRS